MAGLTEEDRRQAKFLSAGVRTMEAATQQEGKTRRTLERLGAEQFWRGVSAGAQVRLEPPCGRG